VITAAALLVLVALGLFIWGIATGATALYWACVVVSAVAAVVLLVAFLRMRRVAPAGEGRTAVPERAAQRTAPAHRGLPEQQSAPAAADWSAPARRAQADAAAADVPAADAPAASSGAHAAARHGGESAHVTGYGARGPGSSPSDTTDGALPGPASPPSADAPVEQRAGAVEAAPPADGAEDPPVEEVEVTDLLLVLDLRDDVLVVDEHPRYHLAGCPWLSGRTTVPLPVDEARTDGFTPCGVCAPDRGLAERERGRRAARGSS
jgi:hypothetical protein